MSIDRRHRTANRQNQQPILKDNKRTPLKRELQPDQAKVNRRFPWKPPGILQNNPGPTKTPRQIADSQFGL